MHGAIIFKNMEDLKEGVVFLKYMGRDIVAEYQSEAFKNVQGLGG